MIECAKFLDEQGVKPCGHSATEKGILLKVYASCQSGQDSAELAYTTRGMQLGEDGILRYNISKRLSEQQETFGIDFKELRYGKEVEEDCNITSDANWSTAIEMIGNQTHGSYCSDWEIRSLDKTTIDIHSVSNCNKILHFIALVEKNQQQAVMKELKEKIKIQNEKQVKALPPLH